MNHWIISETHQRRKKILTDASRKRLEREAMRGRSNRLRGRIADSALAMSGLLAAFAQAVREKN
jgi:dihydropteroate synthase